MTKYEIENACGDLQCALENLLDNDGDEDDYARVGGCIRNITRMARQIVKLGAKQAILNTIEATP